MIVLGVFALSFLMAFVASYRLYAWGTKKHIVRMLGNPDQTYIEYLKEKFGND